MSNRIYQFHHIIFCIFLLLVIFTSNTFSSDQLYLPDGPDLKNKISIIVYVVKEDDKNTHATSVIYNKRKIYIDSKPIITNDDLQAIKLVQAHQNDKDYLILLYFINFNKLNELTNHHRWGERWAILVNNKVIYTVRINVNITNGLFDAGYYNEKEIISLIGIETFKEYLKVFKNN